MKMWKYWQKDKSIYYYYGGKGHLSCTYCTPKHLTNNEKNIETHFAYEDGDSDYGHMDATHLGIIIFFAKQMEALITSFIVRVLKKYKKYHIDIYIYMKNECLH